MKTKSLPPVLRPVEGLRFSLPVANVYKEKLPIIIISLLGCGFPATGSIEIPIPSLIPMAVLEVTTKMPSPSVSTSMIPGGDVLAGVARRQ